VIIDIECIFFYFFFVFCF